MSANPPRGSRRDLVDQIELGRRARNAMRAENSGRAGTRIRVHARASRAQARGKGKQ